MTNRTTTRVVSGYVWCDFHGSIHDDTTDPFQYGEPECPKEEHRSVFVRARPDETF